MNKKLLSIILALIVFQLSWAQCGTTTTISSLIPNPSFENMSCCPNAHSQMTCANNWIQASGATTDYLNTCGYSNTPSTLPPPTPLPNGNGYVGFYDGRNSSSTWKEYLGVCLPSPLVSGTSYTLQISMAAAVATGSYSGSSNLTREFVIYGASNCSNLPFAGTSCPTSTAGWQVVHSQTVTLPNHTSWTTVSFTFTPAFNVYGFIFGGNCSSTTGGMLGTGQSSTNYYFVDNMILNTTTSFQPPVANAGPDRNTTCSSPAAVLNGSASGGTAPYSYSWSGGAGSSQNPTVNPGGNTTYTLTVTDANGCTDTDQVVVNVNKTPPTANAGPDRTTTCSSPSTTLSGSGGGSYSWSPATGLSSTTSATPTANPGSNTTYTVTVTGSNGCTATDQVAVTVNKAPPAASAGPDRTTTCSSPSATLSGSGGGSYSWSPATGLSSTTAASPTANPGSNTTYTVTVTGSNGCTATDQVGVTVNKTPPTANAGPDRTTTCTTPTTTLNASGGGSYSWSPATGLSSTTSATPTANPGSNTTYTVTVTGSNGCTATDQVAVTVNETAPTANAGSNVVIDCNSLSGQESLNGSGSTAGMSYNWTTGGGNIVSGGTTTTPTVSAAGTYTLTVTNTSNGCSATDNAVVTTNFTPPIANAGSDASVDCAITSATLNGSGGGTYSWSPATGLSSTTIASPTASPTTTTTYTLTVTGSNGCTDTDQVTVSYDGTPPAVNAGNDATTTCTTPTSTLNGSGGGTIFSWSPSTGLSNASVSNPVANPASTTTYTLTVTAANGCTASDQVVITVDETAPVVSAGNDLLISCAQPTGTFTGTGAASYSWSTPDGNFSGPTLNIDDTWLSGTFTVTGTAANGCSALDNAILSIDTISPLANAGSDQISNCTTPVVAMDGSGSSGTGITYSWSGPNIISGANSSTATSSTPGTYVLTVTGSNGCQDTDQMEVILNANLPTADAGLDANITCTTTQLSVGGSNTSTGTSMTYSWSTPNGNIVSGNTNSVAVVDLDGDYTLTVLDNSNGCSSSDLVTISMDTITPIAIVNSDSLNLNCIVSEVTADASGSIGANNAFNWQTTDGNIVSGQNTANPVLDQTGHYQLTVTSDNGCDNLNTISVLVHMDTLTPFISLTNNGDFDCETDTVGILATSDTLVTYVWTGPNVTAEDTLNYLVTSIPGTYGITITNIANGCTDSTSVEIVNICPEDIIIPNIFSPNGDESNDIFRINASRLTSLEGQILNRWGQVIFEWDTVEGGWDGTSASGLPSAEGTYYFIITYSNAGEEPITVTGPLQLVR